MRRTLVGCSAMALVLASTAVASGSAAASPVSGPHETIDNQFSTSLPNQPTGFTYNGSYHAAGDPAGDPPYMRRMTSYLPVGLRYDTSVPERCSASDSELEILGSAACPAGSRVGGGTTTIAFLGRFPSTMSLDVFNNTNEQIMLVQSVGLSTVARGRIFPDGSIEYAGPTCFPSVQPAGCPVDNVLQLSSSVTVPPYTRITNGVVRSYITTPPACPATGNWDNPVRFWWADGSVDTVVIHEPCRTP